MHGSNSARNITQRASAFSYCSVVLQYSSSTNQFDIFYRSRTIFPLWQNKKINPSEQTQSLESLWHQKRLVQDQFREQKREASSATSQDNRCNSSINFFITSATTSIPSRNFSKAVKSSGPWNINIHTTIWTKKCWKLAFLSILTYYLIIKYCRFTLTYFSFAGFMKRLNT